MKKNLSYDILHVLLLLFFSDNTENLSIKNIASLTEASSEVNMIFYLENSQKTSKDAYISSCPVIVIKDAMTEKVFSLDYHEQL